jgi:abhydrolase domain-containing protein 2
LRRKDYESCTASFIFYLYFPAEHGSTLYLELAHGGHLGFYEGGLVYPNPITWLDRALVALVGSLALVNADTTLKTSAGMMQ